MRARTIPAWLLAFCLAVAASALLLAGSAPGYGCPTVIRDESPQWIPGTDDLLYTHRESDWCDSPGALRRIPAAGGTAVSVATGVLSGDGTKVAYTTPVYTERGIRVYDLATRKSVQLTAADDRAPAWSPDGKTIAFTRLTSDRRDLHLVSAAGTGLRRLTSGASVERPAFSPDGAWIAFIDSADFDLEVIRTDGTGRKRLLGGVSDFAWAPDAKRLAVVAGPRSRRENAHLVGLDGSAQHLGTSLWTPVFSPNGSVAFAADAAVRIFDPTGHPVASSTTPAVPHRDGVWEPAGPRLAWSPDGQRLAWTTGGRLTIAAADGTGLRTLTGLEAWSVAWSSDGTKLAVGAFADPC